jgi:hypothetical protein
MSKRSPLRASELPPKAKQRMAAELLVSRNTDYSSRSLHGDKVSDAARLLTFKQQSSHSQSTLIEILTPFWQSYQWKPTHWPVGGAMEWIHSKNKWSIVIEW